MTTGDGADGAVTRITNSLLSVSLNGLDLRVKARKKDSQLLLLSLASGTAKWRTLRYGLAVRPAG